MQCKTAPMTQILASVADAIGNTPLVALDRLTHGLEGRILAKLDYLNPGLSKKDRAAKAILEQASADGTLAPGQTVVELTSGNMGTGLAILCAIKGHPFVAVMSRGNSPERARMMTALGAEVVLVDQAPGSKTGQVSGADLALVEKAAQTITAERSAFRADQFNRQGNAEAHYQTTGPEFWAQSGGTITHFADFAGSGGTFAGTTRFLKEQNPAIAQPLTSANHPIQGGGYAMPNLALLENIPIDGYLTVSGNEAKQTAQNLAKTEGIFGGFSGGANVAAALQLLKGSAKGGTIGEGGTIGVVICDSGMKYLSTDLWP